MMTHEQKVKVLRTYGFTIGDRDPSRKPSYQGRFMVLESDDEADPDDDWCVVGDDIVALVDEAFDHASIFDHFNWVCESIASGGDGIIPK